MPRKRKLSSHTIANLKYAATHMKQIKFNLHLVNDSDIINRLEEVENKQGYIKELIRADIAKNQQDDNLQD